jgi:hypothetical protein
MKQSPKYVSISIPCVRSLRISAIPDRFSWSVDPSTQTLGASSTRAISTETKLEYQGQVAMHKLNEHFYLNYDKKYYILICNTLKAILLSSCPCISNEDNTWKVYGPIHC